MNSPRTGSRAALALAAMASWSAGVAGCRDDGSTKADASPASAVTPPAATDGAAVLDAGAEPDNAATDAAPDVVDAGPPPPYRWKRVLQIGDSMVGYHRGLSWALEKRFKAAGVAFFSQSWTSEAIQTLSEGDKIEKIIKYYKPDAVILNLGTNNLTVPHPEGYAWNVRAIAKKLAGTGDGGAPRDCYWISPPTPKWKWNPKVLDVIRENAAPCAFFDSTPLELEIQTDHIHPTDKGGDAWATAFWAFMVDGTLPEPSDDAGSLRSLMPAQ